MSDYKGAALMLPALPTAKEPLADKGYDADWFRAVLANAASPSTSRRNSIGRSPYPMTPSSTSSATKSKTCSDGSKIGGIHARCGRCAHTYLSARPPEFPLK
jgi:hypothetical protein